MPRYKQKQKELSTINPKIKVYFLLLFLSLLVGFFVYNNYYKKVIVANYVNEEFDFSLNYPKRLGLMPKIRDIKRDYKEYMEMCKNPDSECGGGSWPIYEVDFVNKKGQNVFWVRTYDAKEYRGTDLKQNLKFGGISPASKEITEERIDYEASFKNLTYTFTGNSKKTTLVGSELTKREEDFGVDLDTLEKIGDSFRIYK